MAKQTQEEKLIAQINAARQAGQLTQAQAQALRQTVKSNSTNGNAAAGIGKQVAAALAPKPSKDTPASGGPNPNPGKTDDTPASGGPRPTPTPAPTDPTPTKDQPTDVLPPGYKWEWDPGRGEWGFTTWPDDPRLTEPAPDETTTTPAPTPGNGATPAPGMGQKERDGAKKRLEDLLRSYGLESLIDTVKGLVDEWGANNDSVIMSYLRESTAYKERFKGNQYRIDNKYGAMSEAEYISTETSIRAKMRDFGLDEAFYTNERIASLIGGDVSADEVTDRLTKAKKIVDNADANIKGSLVSLYGANLGDLIGYVLDPKLAQESLQRKVNAGVAYGVAKGNGLTLDTTLAEQVGELTYGDERTARQSLGQAGDMARSVRRLQSMESDISLTDADVVEQQFGLDAEASQKVKKLQSRERARFTGSSGAFAGTLNDSSGY